MTFVVTLIALLIERFFDWSHLRSWQWYIHYQHLLAKQLRSASPYLILALTLIPLMLVTMFIQACLKGSLLGVMELVFQTAVFLYCLGPNNFWADTFASMNALTQGDAQFASHRLKTSFGIANDASQSLHAQLADHMLIAANKRVFAIVFWFMILGPVGAILYRAVTLSAMDSETKENAELTYSAQFLESILNFLPVRILTFVFALGGHFVNVFACWRKNVMLGLQSNEVLLTECGAAALGQNEYVTAVEDGSVAKNVIGLMDRSFVIMLVILAMWVMMF